LGFIAIIPIILVYLTPIVLVVLLIRGIWAIKKNSDEHVSQNKQMIALLEEIRDKSTNQKT
jgi:hypothetical protein